MDKHLTYYTLLESFDATKQCPFRYLEERTIKAYFDAILYEAINDPRVRAELIQSQGYCNRHCPKCQELAKQQWLLERERDLLEVGYFAAQNFARQSSLL